MVVIRVEHTAESPLRPAVEIGVAGAHHAVPIIGETDFGELRDIACHVLVGGLERVLTRLNSVLLRGQTIGIEAHRMEHIEALKTFVTRVNIRSDIPEWVAYVEACTRRVGEHVEHIEMGLGAAVVHLIGVVFAPISLPFLLYF